MNEQFKRLGVQGDFENPYLTLRPEFEARQVEIFGEMAKKGYIYKGMKAVYWCPEDRTALAEAEIEQCRGRVRFHLCPLQADRRPQRRAGQAQHPAGQGMDRHLTTTT